MRDVIRMSSVVLLMLVASCSDQAGPDVADDVVLARGGRWATRTLTTDNGTAGILDISASPCVADTSGSELPRCTLRHREDAPPLETYSTSFIAVQGTPTYFVVHYLEPALDGTVTKTPFMTVTIPKAAKFVAADGSNLKQGDSVTVTVELDREYFHVEFGPHGSSMRPAATLWYSLEYAEMSGSDADGASVFYRPTAGDAWTRLDTEWYRVGNYLAALIYHFSGYAVAW
jgi:hypothetical protein